jgi:transposase
MNCPRVRGVEGTGSYGAGLARFLSEHGEAVLEVSRTLRAERRLAGKDDSLDAVRIARGRAG